MKVSSNKALDIRSKVSGTKGAHQFARCRAKNAHGQTVADEDFSLIGTEHKETNNNRMMRRIRKTKTRQGYKDGPSLVFVSLSGPCLSYPHHSVVVCLLFVLPPSVCISVMHQRGKTEITKKEKGRVEM